MRRFPNLVPDRPDAGGAALSRQARDFWRKRWTGKSLMAIGMKDPVLGPPVMRALHAQIRNCPPPMEIAEGGHFLQEWGGWPMPRRGRFSGVGLGRFRQFPQFPQAFRQSAPEMPPLAETAELRTVSRQFARFALAEAIVVTAPLLRA